MKILEKVFLIIIILSLSCQVSAATGNDLLIWCNDAVRMLNNNGYATSYRGINEQFINEGACFGYLKAVDDYSGVQYCPSDGVTYGQIVRIVNKYLKDNPAKLNMPADLLTLDALKKSFPCSETK